MIAVAEPHVRLDARLGWQATFDAVEATPEGCGVRLVRLPGSGRPLVDTAGTFGGLTEPTGVAVDPWGRIYVADRGDDLLKRFDPCGDGFEVVACFGGTGSEPRRLDGPRGVAAGCDGRVAVVDGGNGRVQVIDGASTTLLAVIGPITVEGTVWDPRDVVMPRNGDLLVSDSANGLVHRFDRDGRPRDRISVAAPTHLALDACERLYIVRDTQGDVAVFTLDGTSLGTAVPPDQLAGRFRAGPLATDADGNLYVTGAATGTLWRYGCYETCAVAGTPVQFTGASCDAGAVVDGLAFDPDGNPLVVSGAAGAVISLSGPCTFAPEGRLLAGPLDSWTPGCRWHRVVLSGCSPDATSVIVQTCTDDLPLDAEDLAALPDDRWSAGSVWSGADEGDWDCLVLNGPGRYLWVRLTLVGTRRASPVIESLCAGFPRQTSADDLPGVFRSGPDGGDFVERLMAVLDATTASVEATLDGLPALFDPMATPATPPHDDLSWLASWLGLALEPIWSEPVRRALVAHGSYLFAHRGTPDALRAALRIVLGLDPGWCGAPSLPTILESYKLRRWLFLDGARLDSTSMLWGKRVTDRLQVGEHSTIGTFEITDLPDPLRDPFLVYAHRATVFFPAAGARDEGSQRMVEHVVDLFTPAHVRTTVEFVEPRFLVGIQATVGIDAVVGPYPDGVTLGDGVLGSDTVLQDDPSTPAVPGFQVARDALLGSSVL